MVPQRKEVRRKFLDASIVPLEHSLMQRASELEQENATAIAEDRKPNLIRAAMADEFRKLAEELHHW